MFKNKAILLVASTLLALPGAIQAQGVTPTAAGKGNTVGADQIIQRYAALAGSEANAKSLVNGLRTGAEISLGWTEKKCTQYAQGACIARAPDTCIERNPSTCTEYNQACTPTTTTTCAVATTPPGCKVGSPGCMCPKPVSTTTTSCVNGTCKTLVEGSCKTLQQGACTSYAQGACSRMEDQPNSLKFSPGAPAPMGFGNVDIALALTEAALRPNVPPSAANLRDKLLEILGKRAAGDGWGKIAKTYGLQLQE